MIFHTYSDIQQYAESLLMEHGLHDWSFSWDKAKMRLGCCKCDKKTISLSYHFVTENADNDAQIQDTVLHELAHALAWTRDKEHGHGYHWKKWCRILGARPKAFVRRDEVNTLPPRYLLKLRTTGEIVREYHKKPTFSREIHKMWISGRPDTLGQLELWVLKQPSLPRDSMS